MSNSQTDGNDRDCHSGHSDTSWICWATLRNEIIGKMIKHFGGGLTIDEIEDIVQHVILATLGNLQNISNIGSQWLPSARHVLSGYTWTGAERLAWKTLRKKRLSRLRFHQTDVDVLSNLSGPVGNSYADGVEFDDIMLVVVREMQYLPDMYRYVLTVYIKLSKESPGCASTERGASALGITKNQYRGRLARAKSLLLMRMRTTLPETFGGDANSKKGLSHEGDYRAREAKASRAVE